MKHYGIFENALRTERKLKKLFLRLDLTRQQQIPIRMALEELSRGLIKVKNKIDLLTGNDAEKSREQELQRGNENRLRLIVEHSPDVIFQQDRDLRYKWVLGALSYSHSAREVLGKTDFDLFSLEDAKRFSESKLNVIKNAEAVRLEDRISLGGKERYFNITYEPWRDSVGKVIGITGYMRDITDRKLAEKALEMSEQKYSEMSIRDPISGLYNLRYFYESLKTEVERVNRYQYPLSILMLDIDNFKSINNRYGHQEGDRVIMRMGEIIRRYIRQVDSAYRFGGEEFSIILPETEDEEAIQVAERIRLGFKKENFSPKIDEKFHLTVSIGVARYFPKEEVIAFLKRVDDNLYTAKSQGKDRVYYQEKGGGSSFLM
jgi:diguanylate cyclase (GGDEF)-like protein/PAS domain S-box-containing protein